MYQVTVLPSARRFSVLPDETILNAAIREGVGLPYSCRDGTCGSCKSKLVSGTVALRDYSDSALSIEEKNAGSILPCCSTVMSDVVLESDQVVAEGMHPVRKMSCRVLHLERPAPDVVVLRIQLPGSEKLKYHPGQYLELALKDGTRRSYSMATAHGDEGIEFHIRHMPGGLFSSYAFVDMKLKEVLKLEGPYGSFFLREQSRKPIVFLASGTGFAPIKAILEKMRHESITTPAVVYWGCRVKSDLYMHDWMLRIAEELPNVQYIPVLSEPLESDNWTGKRGFVHKVVMEDITDMSGHQVYACGAPIVVDSARAEFTAKCNLPESDFFADSFVTNKK